MSRNAGYSWLAAVAPVMLAALMFAGCGDGGNPISMDTIGEQDLVESDVVDDAMIQDDVPVDRDITADGAVPDEGEDTFVPPDAGEDITADVREDVPGEDVADPDTNITDIQEEDTTEPVPDCASYDDCADGESCVFSLGVCQRRSTWTADALGLFNIHAMDGAVNDRLIIDGDRFTTGGLTGNAVTVKIGDKVIPSTGVAKDENRLFITVLFGMAGAITVTDNGGNKATIPGPFKQSVKGLIACDGTTPAATGVVPDNPWEAGPYAAGYVDIVGDTSKTRVYYPAECGSVRRPAATGTYPLVVILHGNAALHLQYEYLAELFATWGFVSISPVTQQNMAGEEYAQFVSETRPVVDRFLGRNLADEHAVLANVTTTDKVFFVGHSRGTGRAEELTHVDTFDQPDLEENTVGGIYLGPVDDAGWSVEGALMVFGGGKDMQSGSMVYEAAYNEHTGDKWLIEIPGGNHGSFCDHKVYGYGALGGMGDKEPTISRHEQHKIVQMYAVPMLQRAFGLDEPFASYLDNPVSGMDYTIVHEDAEVVEQ